MHFAFHCKLSSSWTISQGFKCRSILCIRGSVYVLHLSCRVETPFPLIKISISTYGMELKFELKGFSGWRYLICEMAGV